MGQTSRFLEKIYAERDYMSELQSKIETTVAALCDGDVRKVRKYTECNLGAAESSQQPFSTSMVGT